MARRESIARVPVQRNKTLYRPCIDYYSAARRKGRQHLRADNGFVARTNALMNFPSMSGATSSTSSLAAERKIARFFDFVNARRLDVDVFKTGAEEFVPVFKFFECTRDAADPELDAFANVGRNFAAHERRRKSRAARPVSKREMPRAELCLCPRRD